MNKQEAIEKIKNIDTLNINDKIAGQQVDMVIKNQVLDIVSHIDEPKKVTIPKFVAEWIGYCKFKGFTLLGALDPVSELGVGLVTSLTEELRKGKDWAQRNQETFTRAWLYGYEIEQEKLYTVEIPNPNLNAHVVLQKTRDGLVLVTVGNAGWAEWESSKLTEAEIKQDFEWAFQFAKEVE
mgnify:FL=1